MGSQVVRKSDHRGRIRIIGGKWRNRQIPVIAHASLRPTPDRVRETLFNWLTGFVQESNCLDLFAGSGALGFEALSRGAKKVVFVDNYPEAVKSIYATAKRLNALEQCEIILSDAFRFMRQSRKQQAFDIIFLDPPFGAMLLPKTMGLLAEFHFVHADTLIYIESATNLNSQNLPLNWQILKQKNAGEVAYHLIKAGLL